MRTRTGISALLAVAALGGPLVAAAVPALGASEFSSVPAAGVTEAVEVLPSADELPSTRMKAVVTGPLQFSFVVRPKLPPHENWKVVLKVKECGKGKKWIVVQRTHTRTRAETFTPDAEKWARKLMRDDGRFSGIRAFRLITPEQRGYARTVTTFREYPLLGGLVMLGHCPSD